MQVDSWCADDTLTEHLVRAVPHAVLRPAPLGFEQSDVAKFLAEEAPVHCGVFDSIGVIVLGQRFDIVLEESTGFTVNVDEELILFEVGTNTRHFVDALPIDGAVTFEMQAAGAWEDISGLTAAAETHLFVVTHSDTLMRLQFVSHLQHTWRARQAPENNCYFML
jgi:hypothetical protein